MFLVTQDRETIKALVQASVIMVKHHGDKSQREEDANCDKLTPGMVLINSKHPGLFMSSEVHLKATVMIKSGKTALQVFRNLAVSVVDDKKEWSSHQIS